MATVNLFALLAKWGELSQKIGNPAWEKHYRSYRHDVYDTSDSGIKRCLESKIEPVLSQFEKNEVQLQIEGLEEGEVEAGMHGLGLLLIAPLDRELCGRISLCVLNQVELPQTRDTVRFVKCEDVNLDPENLWTREHFLQLIDRGQNETFLYFFRRWFANEEVEPDLRRKWAFILWRCYLREHKFWPKSSQRYKVKRNQRSIN